MYWGQSLPGLIKNPYKLVPGNLSLIIDCKNDKPILRPLSDLTKEIEHNGERFVPIVALLKEAHPQWIERHPEGWYAEIDFKKDGWYAKAWFSFQATHDISIHTDFLWNEPQWKISRLFEWHFDVFDLHSKNLCIYHDELK